MKGDRVERFWFAVSVATLSGAAGVIVGMLFTGWAA